MDDFATGDEPIDRVGVSDDVDRSIADLLGGLIHDDPAVVDDDDLLDEIGDLVDEVAREHDGARKFGVVGDETVVESLPGHGVEAEVGLIEERDLGPGREADDDSDGGLLTAGELLDRRLQRQIEVSDELVGEVLIPVREEQTGVGQGMPGIRIVRILLALADEAHAIEHAGVLIRVLPENLDVAAGREVLGRENGHQRGLAGAVASEQTVDRVLIDAQADIVECSGGLVRLGEAADLDDGVHGSSLRCGRIECGGQVEFSGALFDERDHVLRPQPEAIGLIQQGLMKFSEKVVRCSLMSRARAPR